jgi:hypothetical protein
MSSSAAQLRQAPRRQVSSPQAVMGRRVPQTLQPERGLRRPAGGRIVVAVEDVRTPATPFLALSASSVRPADVRPHGRGGRPVSRRPVFTRPVRSRCLDGQASVSTRPARPRCPHRAGSATRRCVGTGHVWRTGFEVLLSTAGLGRRFARAGCGAALAGWATRQLVQCRAAGRLAGAQGRSRRPQVPPQVRPGQVAGVMPGPWGWTGRWLPRCVVVEGGVGRRSSGSGGPIRSSGSGLRPRCGRRRGGALSARS